MENTIIKIEITNSKFKTVANTDYVEIDGTEFETISSICTDNGFRCKELGYDDLLINSITSDNTTERVEKLIKEIKKATKA